MRYVEDVDHWGRHALEPGDLARGPDLGSVPGQRFHPSGWMITYRQGGGLMAERGDEQLDLGRVTLDFAKHIVRREALFRDWGVVSCPAGTAECNAYAILVPGPEGQEVCPHCFASPPAKQRRA